MSRARIIAKNASVLLASQIISFIFGFLFIVYVARYLGVEGYGTLSFAIAFTSIMSVFADLGLSVLTTREVTRDKSLKEKYFGNIATIKIILSFLTLGLIIFFINLFNYPEGTINLVYIMALYVITVSFSNLFYAIFQAYEKMEYQSIGQIMNNILLLSGALFAISENLNITYFALTYLLVGLINLVYAFSICSWKLFTPRLKFDLNFWKPTLKEAWPLSVAVIFSIIYFKVDVVLLSLIKGNMVVGWYVAAYNILEFLLVIPVIFTTSIYPLFSQLHLSSPETLQLSYERSFKYLIILGIPIATGITVLAGAIIPLIYGPAFSPAIISLQILIWTTPIIFLTYMLRFLLISKDKQFLVLKIIFICMAFNIILNLILIPKYSYLGTSLSTVATELLLLTICFHYISQIVGRINIRFIIKPIIASGFMALFLIFFKTNIILGIIISILIYFTILIALKTFSGDDLDLLRKIFNKGD